MTANSDNDDVVPGAFNELGRCRFPVAFSGHRYQIAETARPRDPPVLDGFRMVSGPRCA
jgi:hypothetical protein